MRILHYTSGMEKPNDAQDNTPSQPQAGQTEGPREPTIGLEDPAAVDTPTGTEEVSLSDLINQAKRTHELVDAVDLKKVVAHDDEETQKLGTIKEALQDLEAGRAVDHVEGVDEVVQELDEAAQQRAALLAHLTEWGWAERVGRVLFSHHENTELRPIGLITHQEGLPEFSVCLAPETGVGAGSFGLFISDLGVFAGSINEPTNKHHWRIARSRPYESPDELKQILEQFSRTAFE